MEERESVPFTIFPEDIDESGIPVDIV